MTIYLIKVNFHISGCTKYSIIFHQQYYNKLSQQSKNLL